MTVHAPLSFSQESLWLTEEIVPGLSQYQMIVVFELGGDLDRSLLERSAREVVERHELLRSAFGRVEGVPRLTVHELTGDVLGFVDLSTVPPGAAADAALRAVVSRWYTEPFDLASPPLLRGEVVRLAPRRHVLVLATHHIVGDEQSLNILQRELFACYEAFAAGEQPGLPELPVQYADFSVWQRDVVEPELETGLAYWAERLQGVPTLPLPTRQPRPSVRSFTAAWTDLDIDPRVVPGLTHLAQERDTSLFTVLLAAYDLLLAQWTGSSEVVVGTPVAGRPEPELENLIGFFVNSVVLRTRCEPQEPFTALLDRVKSDLAEDLAAEHVPFHRVVERVHPPRDRSSHPLFQTAFHSVSVGDEDESGTLGRLTVTDRSQEFLRAADVTTEYDLVMEVVVASERPRLTLRYAAELFAPETMDDLAAQYGRLLEAIAADPCAAPRLPDFRAPRTPATGPDRREATTQEPVTRTAPAGVVTAQVLAVLAEELGVSRVGVTDDFFALGGSSLIGARAVQRLRDELGLTVTLIDLFDAETLGDLVAVCGVPEPDGPQGHRPDPALPRPARATSSAARLWALNRQAGDRAGVHNVPNALRLVGEVNVEALRAALGDLAARHQPLRTLLPEQDGVVRPVVLDVERAGPGCEVTVVEPAELAGMIQQTAARRFDLEREVPWRARLFRVQDEWLLLLVLHAVATDAWSTRPLLHDLTRAYAARVDGREPSWEPLPLRYSDFVERHPELTGAQDGTDDLHAAQLDYWKKTLADLPEHLPLPVDRPRGARPSLRGDTVIFDVPPDVYCGLSALASEHRANLFMVLQAGLAALLTRHKAGTDIPLGCSVAGRDERALDDLVGSFANTLVLRIDTSGAPSFEELLDRVRRTCLDAFVHQGVPFARVVEELRPPDDTGTHPLFQVFSSMCTSPVGPSELSMPGLRAELAEAGTGLVPYDLAFEFTELCSPDSGELWGVVEYATDLFDRDTVSRLVDDLLDLLGTLAADPGASAGH
ncbi:MULTISPECIES: condensation domain-containing protein [unclassified Streptomyces]|uniref:condensation domain-containing protein n=1 Tax=unclassified Streptomyces TaxID=2593676 RepID=UPI0036E3928C